jgi:ATP-dependent Clp protease ATP-binding subunit ClpC
MDAIIKKELKNKFSPEFLNRLDDIILFDQLSKEDIVKIVDIELDKFNQRMQEQGYSFKFTKPAREFLALEGYDPTYGVRPLKRAIQKYVEDLVADHIIEGTLKKDKTYTIGKLKTEDKLNLK